MPNWSVMKLTRTVELISGYDSSWTQYIHSLAGSAAKTEEELHEAWLDKEDGFPVQVDAAHEAIDYITSKLREFERALFGATPSSPSPTVALSREPTPAPAPFSRSARLSDIPLETFDGNIKKWPEFWAMFSLIHDDPTVNAVVKLSELKRLLRGDAKLALEGLPLKKENYGVAVELLRTTYGSTEQLKTELYHELCSLPPVSDRADDLSRFVLKVKRICLQLESLGEDVNTTLTAQMLGHATFVNPDTPEIASQYVAFLDSGSNRSFILPEVAEALKLRPKRHLTLVVNAFRSTTAQRFQVSGKDRSDELAVMVVDSTLEKFWSLETLGIRDDPVEKDDDVARRILREGIRKVGDRYEASLLWNTDNPQLPDNLELCMRRLQSVCGSLSKRPEGLRAYDKVLREHIADGTVAKHTSAVGHCLPHHAVYKAGKEEPRIVFDASAKPRKNAHSLNERLYRGPVSLPALAGIILRSRIPPTVCWADVKKAFHQILLREEDKQFVCFMWPKDIQKPPSWENVEFYHFEVIAKAIGRKLLTADQFMTVLAQIEAIVNSRPLGYLYNDLESGQPVRPIDLITPGAQLGWPASDMEEGDETYLPPDADSSERVLAQAAAVSQALDRFWNMFSHEYLKTMFLGIVAIGVTYYLLSILIKLLTISCMCCYFAFRWARGMKNWCRKYCRRDKTETVSIQLASSKSRFLYRPANSIATKIMIVMIVTLLTTGADSCTDIVSLSGKTSECLQDRVFSCPVWKREARVKMELTIGNQTAETIENLVAGQRYGWNQLKVSLVTMDLSYSPVLNTHFVTDGARVAFHRPTDKIFVCETSGAARDFNCTLSESACTCNARDESVRCTCSAGQKHLLTNDVLPQLIKGVYIQPRGASLLAHFKEEAAAQLQITLDEFSASAMTSNTACEIEVFDFKGCYNCKTGAQMTYRCQSDFATAQADVRCGTNQFLALCTEQGSIGETWLSFGSRLVQETCTVSCPRRQTTFALEGRLNYIADTDASSLTLIDTLDTVRNVNGSIPWDQLFGSLSFLSSFNIFGKLWSSLSNVMNGIVLVVVIWMALYVRTIVTRIRSLYHVVVPKKVL
ncbi:hypothetical protein QR680_016303 [Steinernema hermaphroditum]|uniref:Phlebovirus glycoprotein G2 fusion domain-containing protein n=1 Tax=Steinernema hermaphroditum TaxID=289476 RepID=A0AA39HB14_9BILA|nr:hypothetical protein QR680_016303 [Steinernema hermaphroditum]